METILQGAGGEVVIGPGQPTAIIGERINPTGRKAFSAELQAGDLSRIARDAQAQADAGAAVLDVNVGAAGVDEVALLPQAIQIVQDTADLPVCIDSANPEALAAGLRVIRGRALVNSVNGEMAKMKAVFPVVAEYGAAVIALCMDDSGIPATPEARLAVAENILKEAAAYGIAPEAVLLDPLVLAVGADHTAGQVTAEAARLIRANFGCNMTAGASNASHGMPERQVLNTVFLALLIQAGVNAPICNPLTNGLAVRAADLMLGLDEWGMRYIQTYRAALKAASE
ncbi:MAG: dihydropteroate synthase [Chloroflexi bacterium]|nr:dihydropteroate synthase [Chloroflexota bacterium]